MHHPANLTLSEATILESYERIRPVAQSPGYLNVPPEKRENIRKVLTSITSTGIPGQLTAIAHRDARDAFSAAVAEARQFAETNGIENLDLPTDEEIEQTIAAATVLIAHLEGTSAAPHAVASAVPSISARPGSSVTMPVPDAFAAPTVANEGTQGAPTTAASYSLIPFYVCSLVVVGHALVAVLPAHGTDNRAGRS